MQRDRGTKRKDTDRQRDKQRGKKTKRQIKNRQTNEQKDKETDRQTEKHMDIYSMFLKFKNIVPKPFFLLQQILKLQNKSWV